MATMIGQQGGRACSLGTGDPRTYRIIVETGGEFSSNVGDEAYFAAMVDLFKERFGEHIEITKFTNDPQKITGRYGVAALYSGYNPIRRLGSLWPTLKSIRRADLYVWGGGQMPLDTHGVLSVIYRLHRPMLAKLLGTPVMTYAIGAGPLDMPHSRFIARHCMRAFDLITVRDHFSVSLLREIGVRGPIYETADSAVVLKAAAPARVEEILRTQAVPLGAPLVGVVPLGPAFREHKSVVPVIFRKKRLRPRGSPAAHKHYGILAEVLDSVIERHGVFVIVIAMDPSRGHGFDDEAAELVLQKMKHPDRSRLLLGSCYDPREIKGILGRCEIVIGSRMHGLVLATGERVPTVGICFTEKIRDFARLTGQEEVYVDAAVLRQPADLQAVVERCWRERQERSAAIGSALDQFSEKVRENVDRLAWILRYHSRAAGKEHPARGPQAQPPGIPATLPRQPPRRRNVGEVASQGLCTSCGTCYAVCPHSNISIERDWDDQPRFVPISESRCDGCGLCWQVCPGRAVDFAAGRAFVFGRQPENALLGHFDSILLTRSVHPEIVSRATSGGTVSEIIRHVLEAGLADGVAVTSMDCSGPLPRPRTWIAREPSDVARLTGSLYMSAPVNAVLRAIREDESAGRIALVGLGCHVQGLRAAQRVQKWLRERVVLAIGLFCGHGVRPAGTWHLLRRLGLHPEEISELAYRVGPMPGRLRATTSDGRTAEMRMCDYSYALTCYGEPRCSMCIDPLCELADISVGDAWLPELRGQRAWNLTIPRTSVGARIIRALVDSGRMVSAPATEEQVSQAQRLQLYQRERGAWARMALRQRVGKKVPKYKGVGTRGVRPADLRRALHISVAQWLAQWRWVQPLIAPAARLGGVVLNLLPSRRRKDALIGRSRDYSDNFFKGRKY